MIVAHLLSVVSVSDLTVAQEFYARLFDAPPTNVPMPGGLAEWELVDHGWVQVSVDADLAGSSLLNLAVDDLDVQRAALASRGITSEDVVEVDKGVRLSAVTDPDGTRITLIGGFRPVY